MSNKRANGQAGRTESAMEKIRKNKFQIKRETTRQQLIEAGMRCFIEKGFAVTTITDIAERTGHTKGAFYFHFQTKEELFFEILRYRAELRRGWAEIPRRYDSKETTLAQVAAVALAELDRSLRDERKWFMVMTDFFWQTGNSPPLRERFGEIYRAWLDEIAIFIDVMKAGGWIDRDKDSKTIATQILAFSEGYSAFTALLGEYDAKTLLGGLIRLME